MNARKTLLVLVAVLLAGTIFFAWDPITGLWQKNERVAEQPDTTKQDSTVSLTATTTIIGKDTISEITELPSATASAPATAAQTADTTTSTPVAVVKPLEKDAVKPDMAKTTKPKPAASAWQAKVDSVLARTDSAIGNLNIQLSEVREVNRKQDSQINALTVDVDWLVSDYAIQYSMAKNNGSIISADVGEFIKAPIEARKLMMAKTRE